MEPTKTAVLAPVTLPCGRIVPNRLAKVAMYEHLATWSGGPPNRHHYSLYQAWSNGPGYGMVITGNVAVSGSHITLGRDLVIPPSITEDTLAPYRILAQTIHNSPESLAIMQLSHSGRQSSSLISGKFFTGPLAPSAVRVGSDIPWSNFFSKLFYSLSFRKPQPMTEEDIEELISRFVLGAKLANESGFDGIQLHAAHGYLLAQFLSPKTNQRTDDYSVETGNDLRLLHTLVSRIREIVPKGFVIGIKLNAGDYATSSDDPITPKQERALNHIKTIAQWGGVDFIEISGGDYESPDFVSTRPQSQRQAFFSHMSSKAVEAMGSISHSHSPDSPPPPLILLTGGLRSPASLRSALESNHAQLLGIGRSSVLRPDIPAFLTSLGDNPEAWDDTPFGPEPDQSLSTFIPRIPLLGAGAGVAWYNVHMRYLAQKEAGHTDWENASYPDYSLKGTAALARMYCWKT